MDTTPVAVTNVLGDQKNPRIAFNGTNFFVVWQDSRNLNSSSWDIYGTRVSTGGGTVTLDPLNGFPLAWEQDPDNVGSYRLTHQDQLNPDVSWNGTNWLAVWEDARRTVNDPVSDIFATRIAPAGTGPMEYSNISLINTGLSYRPRTASSGSSWLVLWTNAASDYAGDIWKTTVSAAGSAGSATALVAQTSTQDNVDLAWDSASSNFLAVWQDSRSGSQFDIYGARLNSSGARVDVTDVAIRAGAANEKSPSVTKSGDKWLVGYEDYRNPNPLSQGDIYYSELTEALVNSQPAGYALETGAPPDQSPILISAPGVGNGRIVMGLYSTFSSQSNLLSGRRFERGLTVAVNTVSNAKQYADGIEVDLPSKIVTASTTEMGGAFYMQDVNWNGGIRVVTNGTYNRGDMVAVRGVLQTNTNGERELNATNISLGTSGNTLPGPLYVRNIFVGGSDVPPLAGQGSTGGQRGVSPAGIGPNNIGLLTHVTGEVTFRSSNNQSSDYFYLYDKSTYLNNFASTPLMDPSGNLGIKVASGLLNEPNVGDTVEVTGITSCEVSGSVLIRVIRPRAPADIVVHSTASP